MQLPSPPQRVRTSRFPQSPSGAAGNGKGGWESPPTSRAAKKSTGSYDSVLSCASTGMRAFASLPDVPREDIIAHRAGVVNTAPASKAICQALVALQIALMWYNLEPPSTGSPGARARKKGGLCPPTARPGLGAAADTSRRPPPHPRREKGEPAGARAASRTTGRVPGCGRARTRSGAQGDRSPAREPGAAQGRAPDARELGRARNRPPGRLLAR